MGVLEKECEGLEMVDLLCLGRYAERAGADVALNAAMVCLGIGFECGVDEIVGIGIHTGQWPLVAVLVTILRGKGDIKGIARTLVLSADQPVIL